jgi:hypothetical protein
MNANFHELFIKISVNSRHHLWRIRGLSFFIVSPHVINLLTLKGLQGCLCHLPVLWQTGLPVHCRQGNAATRCYNDAWILAMKGQKSFTPTEQSGKNVNQV